MSDEAVNETLRKMSEQIGRLEGRLDGIASEQYRQTKEQARTAAVCEEIKKQVSALEREDAKIYAWAGGISAGVAFATAWLRDLFGGGSP